jgi:hypothetical protein
VPTHSAGCCIVDTCCKDVFWEFAYVGVGVPLSYLFLKARAMFEATPCA